MAENAAPSEVESIVVENTHVVHATIEWSLDDSENNN